MRLTIDNPGNSCWLSDTGYKLERSNFLYWSNQLQGKACQQCFAHKFLLFQASVVNNSTDHITYIR